MTFVDSRLFTLDFYSQLSTLDFQIHSLYPSYVKPCVFYSEFPSLLYGGRTFCRKTLCRKTPCRKTFCRTDICRTDICRRTLSRTDILSNGQYDERTFRRKDILPKRQLAENREILGIVTHFSKMCNFQSLCNYKITIVRSLPYITVHNGH